MPTTRDEICEILRRHRLSGDPKPLPAGGMVNDAWQVGDDLIVRVCQREAARDEARRESMIVPLLKAAGLAVPELIASDVDGEWMGWPYTIYERAQGVVMGYCDFGPEALDEAYRQCGRDMAVLHRIEITAELQPHLREAKAMSLDLILQKGRVAGTFTSGEAEALAEYISDYRNRLEAPARPCLLHRDIHPWNLLIDPDKDRLTAIIDWGDASLGEPAFEFASMPMAAVPPMIKGYREAGGILDHAAIQRSLYYGFSLALWELDHLALDRFDRRWWRMPPGGWEEMLEWVERLQQS